MVRSTASRRVTRATTTLASLVALSLGPVGCGHAHRQPPKQQPVSAETPPARRPVTSPKTDGERAHAYDWIDGLMPPPKRPPEPSGTPPEARPLLPKCNHGMNKAYEKWKSDPNRSPDAGTTLAMTFRGSLAAIEAIGFHTNLVFGNTALGIIYFRDVPAFIAHDGVLWLEIGDEPKSGPDPWQ